MAERMTNMLPVPEPGNPDRKRALNVLAQRRYRQRRRERLQALETLARSTPTATSPAPPLQSSSIPQPNHMENPGIPTPAWSDVVFDQSNMTSTSRETDIASDGPAFDMEAILNPGSLPGIPSFDLSPFPQSMDFGTELQTLERSQFTFPDDGMLDVPELQVMKAGLNIAEMMGCAESMWDLTALRIFDRQSIPTAIIPPNFEPTEAQRRLPHHPLFDIFPWPSVRTRFICVFAQPVHMRPPSARDPMALMQLFYDMDDSAEGVRVSGSDWYDGNNWEIGQAVFKNWWWVLDRQVVENSNSLRRKRGASRLMLAPP